MAKKPAPAEAETGTEITTFAPDNPMVVFQSAEKVDELLKKITEVVRSHQPDTSTKKGRDAIKSLAFKVTRTKTALDGAGKALNEERLRLNEVVNAQRRTIVEKLDWLRDEARKPLDEWEAAEEARQKTVSDEMERLNLATDLGDDGSSGHIRSRIAWLDGLEFDADVFQDWLPIAIAAKTKALATLNSMLARAEQAEADAAELERLRTAQAEREEQDRQREAEEAQREQERLAEEQRIADAAAEEQRQQEAAAAAEAQRLADIETARQEEAARVAAAAQVEIDAANAETERLRVAEETRLANEAEANRQQAARDADKAHRSAVMKAAKEAIMSNGGIEEEAARKIVLAIVAGEIPNVTLRF